MIRLGMLILVPAAALLMASCASLTLDRVDFGWPVESVLAVNSSNMIDDVRYGVKASVGELAQAEFQDSTALRGTKLRLLRSSEGFYFITGPRFKNVYVFSPGTSALTIYSAIPVTESGLKDPALNQRPPYVELLDGDSFRRLLTSNDVVEVKK